MIAAVPAVLAGGWGCGRVVVATGGGTWPLSSALAGLPTCEERLGAGPVGRGAADVAVAGGGGASLSSTLMTVVALAGWSAFPGSTGRVAMLDWGLGAGDTDGFLPSPARTTGATGLLAAGSQEKRVELDDCCPTTRSHHQHRTSGYMLV